MDKSHHIILRLKSVFGKYECFDTTKMEGVLIREQFNNLSSSPLVFCQVQKPRHFWHFFSCDPNPSSSHECYNTYTII